MKAEKQKPKGKTRRTRKAGNQPAAARSSPTVPPAGNPPAAATTRRKQSPTVTPAELEKADRYLSTLWSKPAQSGWRNRLQRLRVCTRKNWVKG